jgi:hypothetical protein
MEKKMASLENKIAGFDTRFNTIGHGMVYFGTVMEHIIKATGVNVDDIPKPANYEEEL